MTARRKPWTEEDKIKVRKRDSERKRRDQLTSSQHARVKFLDKKNKKKFRKNMSEKEREKVKEKDRIRKGINTRWKQFNLRRIKEICRINTLLRVRKYRSKLSVKDKQIARDGAKKDMSLGRKRGFLGKYKHRSKRDPNYLNIWRNFLKDVNLDLFIMYNPKLKKNS